MSRIIGWLVGAAAATVFTAAPAAARPDDGAPPPQPAVRFVEVPVRVPVDDGRAEALQMLVAAAIGAGCAARALRRRRSRVSPVGTTPVVIELAGPEERSSHSTRLSP